MSEYFFKTAFGTVMKWDIFSESFPYRAKLYSTLLLTNAFFLISIGVFIAYLSYFVLKRKDKLAWVILFTGGIISWASFFIINIMVGSWIIRILSWLRGTPINLKISSGFLKRIKSIMFFIMRLF